MNERPTASRAPAMIPTPAELFARFERGEIKREELQSLMAIHARELIAEMEEDYQNPAAALLEHLLCLRAASRLVRRHGSRLLREILIAISEMPDFPPARQLWNASHPDVPLHCFLRIRRKPVFRITKILADAGSITVGIEYGEPQRPFTIRRTLRMERDEQWRLRIGQVC